jgi:hypothetical protein
MSAPLPTTACAIDVAPVLGGWIEDHGPLLAYLAVASLASLVLVAALLPLIVVRLDPDHFSATRRRKGGHRGPLHWVLLVARNVVGAVFVLAGIAMLVLPGQGILTILVGVLLLDFPGKLAIERWLVRRPRILRFLNRMRAKRGRPPLRVE